MKEFTPEAKLTILTLASPPSFCASKLKSGGFFLSHEFQAANDDRFENDAGSKIARKIGG
ncbi:hypothetical protein [Turneriella parva]|uniref:hypothetical protein n=1 Tax=Turneriella parva TaxID=29510 RepID=UPI00145DFF5B|nr:hypothetical protein [Turneriella parva]